MKNYLFLITVFLSLFIANSQNGTTSYDKDDFTYEKINVLDRKEGTIMLKGADNSTKSNLTNTNKTSNRADSGIGETMGKLSVSASGGALYNIPIAVPPGINGVVPSVSLAYNSQGGKGIAGTGWNISGISVITRIPATKHHDNYIGNINIDNTDRFSLDGQRLVLKSGTYGADGAEYETENYSNLKIVSYGYGQITSFGPKYFKVTYPDGSFAIYGNSASAFPYTNATSTTTYAIESWQNPQGIKIDYDYKKDKGSQYIETIEYGHVNSGASINKIVFSYAPQTTRRTVAYFNDNKIEKRKTLSKIEVYTNQDLFRKYILSYDNGGVGRLGRLSTVTEYNADGLPHSPIRFNYTDTESSLSYNDINTELGLIGINSQTSKAFPLDMTGNGKMDFVVYPETKDKFWIFKDIQSSTLNVQTTVNGTFEDIFPVSWINHNNKVISGQGLTVVKNASNNDVDFKVYSNGTANPIYYQYTKTWDTPTYTYYNTIDNVEVKRKPHEYVSGDFNGDGLTDVLAIGKSYTRKQCRVVECPDNGGGFEPRQQKGEDDDDFIKRKKEYKTNTLERPPGPIESNCHECNTYTVGYKGVHLIDLKQDIATGFVNFVGNLQQNIEQGDKIQTGDFNGDGKTDIIHIKNNKILVYSLNANNNLTLLWETSTSGVNIVLFGDYNGDGKTDFLVPTANNSNQFKIFISTGASFEIATRAQNFTYKSDIWDPNTEKLYHRNLLPFDFNGDGITDIIEYNTVTYNNGPNGRQELTVYSNIGIPTTSNTAAPFNIEFKNEGKIIKTGNLSHYPIPIFLTSNESTKNLEFATLSNNLVTNFSCNKDRREDVLVRSIENNGITHTINYANLDPESMVSDTDYVQAYFPEHDAIYPNADINVATGTKIVSLLERIAPNTPTLKKIYQYSGAVYNLEGRGFLGFKGMAKSNWHTGPSDAIFNISKYDINLQGALIEQYSQPNHASFLTPNSGYISKTNNTYNSTLSSNNVFKIWKTSSLNQNNLNLTNTQVTYLYDIYNNPTKITTNFLGTGSVVVDINYSNSTGADYHIGRLINKVETTTRGSESFSTEEQFIYNGYLLTERKTKGNGTPFDSESYNYDAFGNIIKTIITPNNSPSRELEFEFDTSGRYVLKSIDVEGLETTFEYNINSGTLKKEINPYGQETNYEYDSWNRLVKIIDYLGKETTKTYQETNNEYTITVASEDGSEMSTIYDPLKRVSKVQVKDILGQTVNTSYLYDKFDRPYKVSEPYIGNSASQWNETEFDFYGRTISQTLHTGRVINISYNGLNTTVDDGVKTVTSTNNAMGNTLSVTDPGGTINYEYYGNGGLKSANYNGVIVSTEQDGWGRKTKMVDPSAGTYEYFYNGFSEVTREITPKGETKYVYTPIGKLIEEIIVGDNTEMVKKYFYHPTNKMLSSIELSSDNGNDANYNFTYDNQIRLISTEENNTHAKFTKQYTYDDFGRVATEEYFAKLVSNGKTSLKKIKNNYENGGLKSMQDFVTNEVLWNVNAVNARGQVTSATMGNDMRNNKIYNTYGYLTESKVEKNASSTAVEIMKLTTDFDTERGTLNSRTNSLFSWSETFGYDNLDRLITFNDNDSDNSNVYDNYGRITTNNTVGDYNYSGTAYQVNTIDLNDQGDLYYQQNELQQVTYNAFKKPVEINEEGKEKIGFQYNAFMGRSHMYYGDTETEILERNNRKHYAYDGSMEISVDEATETTLFVTYLGGDGYSAPTIWRSEQNEDDALEDYYYLHRDYLGSILMISDKNGDVKEKRHFDAWGNTVKLTDGNNTPLDKFVYLDRGYTGHEHLQGVNLIHMNGRLYDPKLRRFLAPDNYIQDISNTQNFNRYGYVLNNPLRYNDPSGEMGEDPNNPEPDSWLDGNGGWLGSLLGSALNTDWSEVHMADWLNTNWDSGRADIDRMWDDGVAWVKGLFKKSDKRVPNQILENPSNSSSDPLAGSSSHSPPSSFGGGGTSEGGFGVVDEFMLGGAVGQVRGIMSSWNFVKSLTTADGWKNLGQSVVNLGHMANQFSPQGALLRSQVSTAVGNYVNNIPNMSAAQIGHDLGYGAEKIAESIILTRGAGLAANALKSGQYVNLASKSATTHILAGNATGGGHAWLGSLNSFKNGLTGAKSMFPANWSHGKIMNAVSEVVAGNPWIQQTGRAGAKFTKSGKPVRFVTEGYYNGVKIRVINTYSEIITAFPIR